MDLVHTLEVFFRDHAPLARGDTLLVAFSGGADSMALLAGLCAMAPAAGVRVAAAHVDHRLDSASTARAEAAERASARLGLPLIVVTRNVGTLRSPSESLEMAARRIRYRELEAIADSIEARYLATAHQLDDQAETLLLRLAAGHDLRALSGIPARRGRIVRPLLTLPRRQLIEFARERALGWLEDPTNRDLRTPRNRIRHLLLPTLERRHPGIGLQLARLAQAAQRANARLAAELDARICPRRRGSTVLAARHTLERLPESLVPDAVVHLLRTAGGHRRPSKSALGHVRELLATRAPIGVDLGAGWRIEDVRGGEFRIFRVPDPTPDFAYNLGVPGEIRLGEIASTLRLRSGSQEPWMFRGDRLRAGLSLTLEPGEELTVRNRRPGDRVHPFRRSSRHKLKDLLIEHEIPKHERDRLPLLCQGERILWVPGVTIDHEARVRDDSNVWVAEIIPDE